MKEIIYTYFLSLPVIFAFDMLWLGFFAKDYYVKMMCFFGTKKIK